MVDREHEVIVKAVLARDITKSRDALSFHLTNVKKELIDNIERIIEGEKQPVFSDPCRAHS